MKNYSKHLFFIVTVLSSIAIAEHTSLRRARALMDRSLFARAIFLLKKNINAADDINKSEMMWQMGVGYISLNLSHDAEKCFNELLDISPDFFPKEVVSPKIKNAFINSRNQFFLSHKDKLKVEIIRASILKGELVIDFIMPAKLKSLVKSARLYFRTVTQSAYRIIDLKIKDNGDHMVVQFLHDSYEHGVLFYYLDFIGRFDKEFTSIGSVNNPLTISLN